MPFEPTPLLRRFEPLRRLRRRSWVGYATAVGAVVAATALRVAIGPHLRSAVFTPFYPAVVLASLAGGAPAGLLATGLAATAANLLFVTPGLSLSADEPTIAATVLFVLVAAFLVWLLDTLTHLLELTTGHAEDIRTVLEAQPAGVVVIDGDGVIKLVNCSLERQLGYSRGELLGRPVEVLIPEALREAHVAHRREFMKHPVARAMGADRDLYALRKDGSRLPVEIGLAPLQGDGLLGAMATVVDIRERKDLEWRAQMLTDEVRHRARNLLTIVRALAGRSLRGEQKETFTGLLEALARTQELFGANTPATLASLAEAELASFDDQVSVSGCDLSLAPRAAQDFSLILHELTTNSLKYGALSTTQGHVAIVGREDDHGGFTFAWTERGGPKTAGPTKKGLGRTILEGVARSFASTVEADYGEDGFRYRLRTDLDRIREAQAAQPPALADAAGAGSTEPRA